MADKNPREGHPVSGRAAAQRGRTKEQAKSTLKLAEKRGRLKQLAIKRGGDSKDGTSAEGNINEKIEGEG